MTTAETNPNTPKSLVLGRSMLSCHACDLRSSHNRVVPGYGVQESDIMFVAEAPGADENTKGKPLIGRSGQLFTSMLEDAKLDRNNFYVTNIVKCRPPQNRTPTGKEQRTCADLWLNKEVEQVDPLIIVPMGDTAYRHFMPDEPSSISQIHGNVFEREFQGRQRFIVPVVHPAFVARNPVAHRPSFVNAMKLVNELWRTGTYTKAHPGFRTTQATWDEILEVVNNATIYGMDLETDTGSGDDVYENDGGLRTARVIGIGVCAQSGDGRYFPFSDDDEARECIEQLRLSLENDTQIKVVSNAKFERHILAGPDYGITLRNYEDTMLQSWVLGDMPLSLKDAFHKAFGFEMQHIKKFQDVGYKQKDQRSGKTMVDMRAAQYDIREQVVAYAAQDPDASLSLHAYQKRLLQERKLWDLYTEIELPFAEAIIGMEATGFKFDTSKLESAAQDAQKAWESIIEELRSILGEDLNVNATRQVVQALYCPTDPLHYEDKLSAQEKSQRLQELAEREASDLRKGNKNIRYAPRTFNAHEYVIPPQPDGTTPTDAVNLALYSDNRLVRAILTARAIKKLIGTYIEGLPRWVENDGRIHANFNQASVSTGRVSSTAPNLQNITARKRGDIDFDFQGSRIREAFVADEGNYIYAPDLSQIEMRVAAHLSRDEAMIRELSGGDIHSNTTRSIYGLNEDEVDPKEWKNMRNLAKTVGFGVLYGLQSQGLLKRTPELGLSLAEAESFIENFYLAYPGLHGWQNEVIRFTRRHGYATTMLGRRRYLADIYAKSPKYRSEAERQAMNHPVQGSAADFFKIATNKVREFLYDSGSRTRIIAQVHDELVMEGPKDELEFLATEVPPIMASGLDLVVPVPVDFDYGINWGDLKPYESEAS